MNQKQDFLDTYNELNNLYEDVNNVPEEIRKLMAQGVPVLSEEPDFIEDELAGTPAELEENINFISLSKHYAKHVASGQQNLWAMENQRDTYDYKFTNLMNRSGGETKYKTMAENLASAEIDGTNVKAFICQATRKEDSDDEFSATKKYSSGEAARNLNTAFRICKYRLNPYIKIPSYNMYYYDEINNKEQAKPTEDFIFANNNIYEVVYYSYSNKYGKYADLNKSTDVVILSYFLKTKEKIEEDLASAKHAFDSNSNLSRYSNKIDVVSAASTTTSQIVNIVMKFNFYARNKVYIIVDLFNSPRLAQEEYAENNSAFLVGTYNGSTLTWLKGSAKPTKDRKEILKYYVTKDGTSSKVDKVLNYMHEVIDGTKYNAPTATSEDLLSIVEEAVEKAERKYIKSNSHWKIDRDGNKKWFTPYSSDLYTRNPDNDILASIEIL